MIRYKKFISRFIASLILIGFLSNNNVFAQGEAIFKAQCANCHKPNQDYTGPALAGVRNRAPSKDWVYKWVANPSAMIASEPYAKALFEKWKPTVMNGFPALKKEEIDAILDYVDAYKDPVAPTGTAVGATSESKDNNSLLFGILTLILAIVAFILFRLIVTFVNYLMIKKVFCVVNRCLFIATKLI